MDAEPPDHEQLSIDIAGERGDLLRRLAATNVDPGAREIVIRVERVESFGDEPREAVVRRVEVGVVIDDGHHVQIRRVVATCLVERVLEHDLGIFGIVEGDHDRVLRHARRSCIARAPGIGDAESEVMRTMLAALATVLLVGPARAESIADASPQIVVIRGDCVPFLAIPGGAESDTRWNQLFSFAACMQDNSRGRVERPEDLAPYVGELKRSLVPALRVYLYLLERGPERMHLHALDQIGMAQVGLLVRARAAIAGSPELRPRLEPMLAEVERIAWLSFAAVVRTANDNPALVHDAITRNIVTRSRELATLMQPRTLPSEPLLADLLQ